MVRCESQEHSEGWRENRQVTGIEPALILGLVLKEEKKKSSKLAPQGRTGSVILKLQAVLKTICLPLINVLHNPEQKSSTGEFKDSVSICINHDNDISFV